MSITLILTLSLLVAFTLAGLFVYYKKPKTVEIEHRFLVNADFVAYVKKKLRNKTPQQITQGYLSDVDGKVVRVRINKIGNKTLAFLTIKGPRVNGSCSEFEYDIPVSDAKNLMGMCDRVIEKDRYKLGRWEIDFFKGVHEGLIIAEIELKSANESYALPIWLGKDVTNDHSYSNNNLSKKGK